MGKKGRRYELKLSKSLNSVHEEIVAYPAGYSGNQFGPSPDIILTSPSGCYAIEIKKVGLDSGERRSVLKSEELEMLEECSNSYTDPWIVISLTNRKILSVKLTPVDELEERIPDPFNPSVTKSNNLRITKPETSNWPSKRKQDEEDSEIILNSISDYVDK